MKRVAFDVSMLAEAEPTGVARAGTEILRAIAQLDHEFELVLVAPRAIPSVAREVAPRATAHVIAPWGPRRLWRELGARSFVREARIDLWYAPVTAVPVRVPCPRVATVHELAYLDSNLGARDGEGTWVQRWRIARAAKYATRIACSSAHTLQQFQSEFPSAATRARCVPLGTSSAKFEPVELSAEQRQRWVGGAEPYVLVLGTLREKKDPHFALAIMCIARWKSARPYRLVFAGPSGPERAELEAKIIERDFAGWARVVGFVPEKDLPALLGSARALLQLSQAEGCGLPVLEAQAARVPVIATDLPVLRETSGGAACFVGRGDAHAAAAQFLALEKDPNRRNQLQALGTSNARQRSWTATAQALLSVWREDLQA